MFKQIDLSYGFADLEPHIDELTMVTHYTKHHAAYTNNLNAAIEKDASLSGKSIEEILLHLDAIGDGAIRTAVRNNGEASSTTTSTSIRSAPRPSLPQKGSSPTASPRTSVRSMPSRMRYPSRLRAVSDQVGPSRRP